MINEQEYDNFTDYASKIGCNGNVPGAIAKINVGLIAPSIYPKILLKIGPVLSEII